MGETTPSAVVVELAHVKSQLDGSVNAWLEAVHDGYAARFGNTFADNGYSSLAEIRGMTREEVEGMRSVLAKAGAKAPQLRLIEGAIADLAAPVAMPTAEVVSIEPPPVATQIPTRPPHEAIVASATGTSVVKLHPNEAIQVPVAPVLAGQNAGLERIYLGMGWRERDPAAGVIDVDCSVTGFAAGYRLAEHTVSYLKLHNAQDGQRATIVHTGDILYGQQGAGPAVDLERIYVDLSNLPAVIDALALEANVYTNGVLFSALSTAYVRLVNADTNQELARMDLEALGDSRVSIFTKLFRVTPLVRQRAAAPEWRMVAAFTIRDALFRHDSVYQASMIFNAPQPLADTPSSQQSSGSSSLRPKTTYSSPPIALATAAGVAAAIAIFANPDDLSVSRLDPSLFETGVDYSSAIYLGGNLLVDANFFTGCSCCEFPTCDTVADCSIFGNCGCADCAIQAVDRCCSASRNVISSFVASCTACLASICRGIFHAFAGLFDAL